MIAAGLDIGSTTSKAVLFDGTRLIAGVVLSNAILPADSARQVLDGVLAQANLSPQAVGAVAVTGYGRRLAGMGDLIITEIRASALGARFLGSPHGPIRTVLDLGGQDTKVIALADTGDVQDFAMNDKCAAGTGRFLEMLARKLDLSMPEFIQAARSSTVPIHMNSTCAVFAESEVVSLLARNVAKADIAAAAHQAIADRIAAMVRRIGPREILAFVGGGALNRALLDTLEENLGVRIWVPPSPQTVVALGAALAVFQNPKERSPLP